VIIMWPVVEPQDVADRWRPLTPAEETVAATRIKDAEAELREQLRLRGLTAPPTFDTTGESDDWEQRYVSTVADSVRRFLANTEGVLEETERLDDWSRTIRRDSAVSAGLIYVDDAAVDRLVPTRRRRRGAFTIALGTT
jgi:hypothetical protein